MDTGIYCIKNKVNGKRYIGSSSYSLDRRMKHHKNSLRRGDHCNGHFQRSWNKYGEDNFEFSILEYVEPTQCLIREQWYLDNDFPEYNICKNTKSLLGIKRSIEVRKKLSLSKMGRKNPMFGKIGKLNHESRPTVYINLLTGECRDFESIKELSNFINMKYSKVGMILTGANSDKSLRKLGFTIKYKEVAIDSAARQSNIK